MVSNPCFFSKTSLSSIYLRIIYRSAFQRLVSESNFTFLAAREEISAYLQANRLNVKSSQEYSATYSKNEDGSYNVELKIYEPLITKPIFSLNIKAPSRQTANEAIHKWKTNAPLIYELIYEKLINTD